MLQSNNPGKRAMPKFFIDRPVFAWVISLFIMMAGAMAIVHLPIAEYPSVAPPSISITATYLGASAETVQNTVTAVIEEQMSGLDHLLVHVLDQQLERAIAGDDLFRTGDRPGHRPGERAK